MLLDVLSDAGKVYLDVYSDFLKDILVADSGKLEDLIDGSVKPVC